MIIIEAIVFVNAFFSNLFFLQGMQKGIPYCWDTLFVYLIGFFIILPDFPSSEKKSGIERVVRFETLWKGLIYADANAPIPEEHLRA